MHITAHQLLADCKNFLFPAIFALLAALAIPVIGFAIFFLRGFAALALGLLLTLGLLHMCVTRHRPIGHEDKTDA